MTTTILITQRHSNWGWKFKWKVFVEHSINQMSSMMLLFRQKNENVHEINFSKRHFFLSRTGNPFFMHAKKAHTKKTYTQDFKKIEQNFPSPFFHINSNVLFIFSWHNRLDNKSSFKCLGSNKKNEYTLWIFFLQFLYEWLYILLVIFVIQKIHRVENFVVCCTKWENFIWYF